jgi:hypothetical protein
MQQAEHLDEQFAIAFIDKQGYLAKVFFGITRIIWP